MKIFIVFFAVTLSIHLYAQDHSLAIIKPADPAKKVHQLFNRITLNASIGSGYYQNNLKDLKRLTPGEFSLFYKTNSRLSFGIGSIGALLCNETVLDAEGNPIEREDDLPDSDDEGEVEEDTDDDPDENECEDDFEIGDNLMGLFSYRLSDALPFFVSAGAGYSFNAQAPAYTFWVGYHQKIISSLGIRTGIRYSDIVNLANTPNFASSVGGIKVELGVSWNF